MKQKIFPEKFKISQSDILAAINAGAETYYIEAMIEKNNFEKCEIEGGKWFNKGEATFMQELWEEINDEEYHLIIWKTKNGYYVTEYILMKYYGRFRRFMFSTVEQADSAIEAYEKNIEV